MKLESTLAAAIADGRKVLVPYVTGGLPGWDRAIEAAAVAGADAMEIGLPFSDPVMDGPVIQEASDRALRAGTTPPKVFDRIRQLDVEMPLAVMTYYNLVFHAGHERFAASLAGHGVDAVIVPDLPLEEAGPWCAVADGAGIETVLLAAPTASDERLARICERARGFVYGVGLLGVTGVREQLAESAMGIAKRLKSLTDKPVLVGVGISTPEQALQVTDVADGVVVGSNVVRQLLEGRGPEGVAELVGSIRSALDRGMVG